MAKLSFMNTGTTDRGRAGKPVRRAALSLVAMVTLALALSAAPAGAIVTTVGPAKVGLQPREANFFFDGTLKGDGLEGLFAVPSGSTFANPSGGAVLPANNTYAIYWDPTYHYHNDWAHVIDTFFHNMGADSGSLASVFAVDAQYTDAANQHAFYKSTFQGAYTDTDQYPTVGNCSDPAPLTGESHPDKEPDAITCLTNAQIQHELEVFIANHGLQKGMSTVFYLMTPPGVTVCLDGGKATGHCSDYTGTPAEESYKNSFCSYHSDISPTNEVIGDERTILYAVIPWTAGGLGDGHLAPADQVATEAYRCQDGGFDPSSKPIEKKEKAKEKKIESVKEKEEKTKNPEEQKEQEEAEQKAAVLEGPHQQEPNQVPCPSPDGFCDTGLADLIINQIAVEQQNIVTDPLLNAWQQQELPHNEATDECRNFFAPVLGGSVAANPETYAGSLYNQSLNGGNYYLNDAFNLAAQKLPYPGITCLPGIRLEPLFTAPNPVNSGEIVGFDGMESDITLNEGTAYTGTTPKKTYATYKWNFGDKTPEVTGYAPGAPSLNSPETSPCELPWRTPCAASTFHSYQYGETYNVTLTVTDTGGNTASVTEPITVVGPPRPSSTPPGNSSGPGSGGPAAAPVTGAPQGPPAPIVTPIPPPVVTDFAMSKSLKKVLSGGLAVRYTANEQVAGSIQVLLDAVTAKRLGIHGATATGLPAGSRRSIVVGTAVLVTTKAGQGTIKIKFSPRTAARLKHTHNLKLTLRLFARNASRQSPQTTTVLSTVVLNH